MDIRFENLASLHWLWAVAVIAIVLIAGQRLRRRALRRFATDACIARLLPPPSPLRTAVRTFAVVAALVCLVASMIDPRWGVVYRQVQQRGVDIIVVLDVSRSMLAEDAKPNRLGRAKQFIGDLVQELGGDRIGLVTFAGTASLKCPLTVDYGAFRLALETVAPQSAARGGSLLGDALRTAVAGFPDDVPDHKVIIVFSDGEDQGSYPVEAARGIAEESAVPVYTVGIGDDDIGARIPVGSGSARRYLLYDGEEVHSKMNAELLQQIALASGGAYVPVGLGTVDMGEMYRSRIEPVAKREFESTRRRRHEARYQWFTALALALILVESLMRDPKPSNARRGRRYGVEVPT